MSCQAHADQCILNGQIYRTGREYFESLGTQNKIGFQNSSYLRSFKIEYKIGFQNASQGVGFNQPQVSYFKN